MGLGMLLAGLSGAGTAVQGAAQDYQKFSDTQALDQARSDLQVEAAKRIEENKYAQKDVQDANNAAIYKSGVEEYKAANPGADSDDANMAGLRKVAVAGKGDQVPGFNAANTAQNAQDAADRAALMVSPYGSKVLDTNDRDPVTGELKTVADSSLGRTEVGLANANARQTNADANTARSKAYSDHMAKLPDGELKTQAALLQNQAVSLGQNIKHSQDALMMTADPGQRVAIASRVQSLQNALDDVNQQQSALTHVVAARVSGVSAPSAPAVPSAKASVKYVPGQTYTDAKGSRAKYNSDGTWTKMN